LNYRRAKRSANDIEIVVDRVNHEITRSQTFADTTDPTVRKIRPMMTRQELTTLE